ncbi:unnamed protein product, partial [Musa acuminata var. zebrina]
PSTGVTAIYNPKQSPREKAVPSFRFLIWLTAGSCQKH